MHRCARLAALVGILLAACSPGRAPHQAATSSPEPTTQLVAPRFWVAVEDARELVLVDVETRRVVRRISVPGRPHNLTVTPGGTVAATHQAAGTVTLVRDGSVSTVQVGGSPHDVKPVRDGLVVANEGSMRLDLLSQEGEPLDVIPLRANPHDVAVRDDLAWVTLDDTDEIAIVDLRRREVLRYLGTTKRPHDLLLAADRRAWVTDWNGTVHVFDDRARLVKTLTLGSEAHHLTSTPDGHQVWITDHGARRAYVVSTEMLEVLESHPIPGAPHHVAITPDGQWAAVADHDRGTVVLFDVRRRQRVAALRVGPGPHGVWAAT